MSGQRAIPKGVTLMELTIYMGISMMVLMGASSFMVKSIRDRAFLHNQQVVQQNSRSLVEKITYSLRNAYDVDVSADGKTVKIYAENYSQPLDPFVTTFGESGTTLVYSRATISAAPVPSAPVLDDKVNIDAVHFEKVASSLVVSFTLSKADRLAHANTTISFRQK